MATSTVLFAMLLGGCAHQRAACERDAGGWCDFVIQRAIQTYPYAQMATNAYNGRADRKKFDLPAELHERFNSPAANSGFTYAIFDRMDGPVLKEVIIAYRGTDSLGDWISGNFSRRQNRFGQQLYDMVRKQLDESGWTGVPITVTGHSLGGGIASSVSQGKQGVRAYMFNSSPNFLAYREDHPPERIAFAERGEFLKLARAFKGQGNQRYLSINCHRTRYLSDMLRDHSVRLLADCLTWISARHDPSAQKSLQMNSEVTPPDSEPPGSPDPRASKIVIRP